MMETFGSISLFKFLDKKIKRVYFKDQLTKDTFLRISSQLKVKNKDNWLTWNRYKLEEYFKTKKGKRKK
jgi:hypothetical protein